MKEEESALPKKEEGEHEEEVVRIKTAILAKTRVKRELDEEKDKQVLQIENISMTSSERVKRRRRG
jgi:hypothetical protein